MYPKDIYRRYHIPLSLQQHMLTVAAVGKYVVDHWRGPSIDGPSIISTLLIHDLGNLVKFDLSEKAQVIDPTLFTDSWRARQQTMREIYGMHSHEATQSILRELGVPEKIQALADNMDADDLCVFLKTPLEQQICEYADLRVTPTGVVPLLERLADFKKRYSHYHGWSSEENYEKNKECGQKLESNLQQHLLVNITHLPKKAIEQHRIALAKANLPVEKLS